MKTLVIIDDEIFFRKAVHHFIDKQENYQIIGEANNGENGMNLILSLKPDIALVDISMPNVNGLEMIERLSASYLSTKFILLTGYGDFEYARQAISLGVKNYLLKPLDNQELLSCLDKISDEIDRDNGKNDLINNYLQAQNIYTRQLIIDFFHKVISENIQPEEFSALQKQLNLLPMPDYLVLILKINDIPSSFYGAESDFSLLHFILENICTEILGSAYPFQLYVDYSSLQQYIILGDYHALNTDSLKSLCIHLSQTLLHTAHISVTIFSGTSHADISGIRISYEEALSSLQNNCLTDNLPFHMFFAEANTIDLSIKADIYEQVIILLRQKKETDLQEYFSSVFEKIHLHNLHIRQVWNIALTFLTILDNFVLECGYSDICYSILQNALNSYQKCENINQLQHLISEAYSSVLAEIYQHKNTEKSSLITDVQDYIAQNYSQPDLRLETIASHFYVSPQYLSSLFSQENHVTLTTYINTYRMQRAKELLLSELPSIQNTATLCGFTDSGYFSKCFRKYYGISPKNFLDLLDRKK